MALRVTPAFDWLRQGRKYIRNLTALPSGLGFGPLDMESGWLYTPAKAVSCLPERTLQLLVLVCVRARMVGAGPLAPYCGSVLLSLFLPIRLIAKMPQALAYSRYNNIKLSLLQGRPNGSSDGRAREWKSGGKGPSSNCMCDTWLQTIQLLQKCFFRSQQYTSEVTKKSEHSFWKKSEYGFCFLGILV